MNKVTGCKEISAQLGEFTFREFSLLKNFCFYSEKDNNKNVLEVELQTEERDPNFEIKLQFSGVTNLKINEFGNDVTRIIGFDIQDVKNNQWEGIAWEVLDYEEDRLHFYAKTARIISCDKLKK